MVPPVLLAWSVSRRSGVVTQFRGCGGWHQGPVFPTALSFVDASSQFVAYPMWTYEPLFLLFVVYRTGNVTLAPAFVWTLNIEMSDLGKLHMLVPRFSGCKHIVNRALGGKNRGINPRINLYLLEASGCFWRPWRRNRHSWVRQHYSKLLQPQFHQIRSRLRRLS